MLRPVPACSGRSLRTGARRTQHLDRPQSGGAAGLHSQLREYFQQVLFHGGLTDAQNHRDVRVGLALGDPQQCLGGARSEAKGGPERRSRGEIRPHLALSEQVDAGSAEAGWVAALIYTLVENCKRNGLDPYAYLVEVLALLPEGDPTAEEVAHLTPARLAAAKCKAAHKTARTEAA